MLNTERSLNIIVRWRNMLSITLIIVLVPLLIYWLYKSSKVPKGLIETLVTPWYFNLKIDFPPGPGRLPIVGSLLSIPNASGVLVACTQWFIKRYGKLVRLIFRSSERTLIMHKKLLLGRILCWAHSLCGLLWLWDRQGAVHSGRVCRPAKHIYLDVQVSW